MERNATLARRTESPDRSGGKSWVDWSAGTPSDAGVGTAATRASGVFARLLKDAGVSRAPLRDLSLFRGWVMARVDQWSFAPHMEAPRTVWEEECGPGDDLSAWLGWPALDVARRTLASESPAQRSLGLACLKALLPVPAVSLELDGFELLEPLAARVPTLVIGVFPKAMEWVRAGYPVTVVDPASASAGAWPGSQAEETAELVVASGHLLLDGWLAELVRRTPRARARVLLGPAVPPSAALFGMGLHALGFATVGEPGALSEHFRRGGRTLRSAPPEAVRKHFWSCRPGFLEECLAAAEPTKDPGRRGWQL